MGLFKKKSRSAVFLNDAHKRTLHKNLEFTATEQYKLLRTNLNFTVPEGTKCPVIGVTSSITLGAQTLNFYPLTYVVVILPALITSWVAYAFGYNNKRFTSLFTYPEPEKTNKK